MDEHQVHPIISKKIKFDQKNYLLSFQLINIDSRGLAPKKIKKIAIRVSENQKKCVYLY